MHENLIMRAGLRYDGIGKVLGRGGDIHEYTAVVNKRSAHIIAPSNVGIDLGVVEGLLTCWHEGDGRCSRCFCLDGA